MNILFIESYDGGSHRAFREGFMTHSRHRVEALTLPARFWKWRMRGAAAWFADQLCAAPVRRDLDLLLVTSLLNVADLRGLLRPPLDRVPIVVYMHENQLTYPLSPQEEFDFHFGFTNILSALVADAVVFNSEFHRDLFLDSLPNYLARMPEAVPRNIRPRLERKSHVRSVGLDREPLPPDTFAAWRGSACAPDAGPPWPRDGRRPLLVWNHRWEFDKEPDLLVRALERLRASELDFSVALLGEPRQNDDLPRRLAERLGERCVHQGFVADRSAYEAWLGRADVVISCAQQEYFGISVAEAIHAGCYPVLPRRQVYPSLYGSRCRGRHLYADEDELVALLAELIGGDECGHVCGLQLAMDGFCWPRLIESYDELLDRVANSAEEAP